MTVIQGNIIDRKDVEKLELGMTKRQVEFVMGKPMIQDTFNTNRWDYYYTRTRGDKKLREKELTLYFEDDKLARMEGNMKPKEEGEATEEAVNDSATDAKI